MRKFLTPIVCTGLILGLSACGQDGSNEAADSAIGNETSNQMVAEEGNLNEPVSIEEAAEPAVERPDNPTPSAKPDTDQGERTATKEASKPAPKAEPKAAPKADPKPATKEPPADATCAPEHRALGHC